MDASSRNGTSNFKLRSYNSVPAELETPKETTYSHINIQDLIGNMITLQA